MDETLFPYQRLQTIIRELFDTHRAAALSPAPAEGDIHLREELGRFYQLPVQTMLIISGAQQGLDLVAKVFGTRISDSILFEDPTYPGAISLFKPRHFVAMNKDGPEIKVLESKLSEPLKLFYTMPSVHNPTGMAYSQEKRRAVATLAGRHAFYIIEDDGLGDLRPDGPRFVDICPERTIYIKSLAQTTLAGIRLGFMVVPQEMFDAFIHAKYSSDISSFGLLQRAFCQFIVQGDFAAHIAFIRHEAARRRKRLRRLIERFPFLSTDEHQDGFSLWVHSRRDLNTYPTLWSRGEEFSFSQRYRSYFKIAFMHMAAETFEEGLTCLSGLFSA